MSSASLQNNNNVASQNDVNSLVCNIMRSADSNIPSSAGYQNRGQAQNTVWGVAKTGTLIMSGLSIEGVDPFYPAAYGSVTDPSSVVEKTDNCLAHPQVAGIFHYHTATNCIPDPSAGDSQAPY